MLDIKFIRENVELLKKTASQKNVKVDIDKLLKLDDKRKKLTQAVEELRTKKNQVSKEIGRMSPSERETALAAMKLVDVDQGKIEIELKPLTEELSTLMLRVPMPVDVRTPEGIDETGNKEIKQWGDLPKFKFNPKNHEELGLNLDIVDFERGVKIAGSRAYVLKGAGARMEGALMKYAEDFLYRKGYTLMSVPVIVNRFALEGTGYFPGGEDEIYHLEKDEKYLVGTSEVSIGAYYANEILKVEDLPLRLAGFSICFRREAGSYGKDTHGLYRVHQFLKIEQFIIGENNKDLTKEYHEELLGNSEEFLQTLQLPYRVLNLCTGDMSLGKHYGNDIECWMPSRQAYGETHSCSTFLDFQARRLNLRYKDKDGKVKFCHTLNNTLVATPRILIPLWENKQNEDGSLNVPEVLKVYMDNQEKIKN